jgi:CHASE3 domain sensor protein
MRFRTWIVAALGLSGLLLLIMVSMLASSRKAQEIYTQLDQLNAHHQKVDATLRRLRSDVNLSGIFVRDYLLDVARERAPEYREQIAEFRRSNIATVGELLVLDESQADPILRLEAQLDEYWQTFEPLFDWTISEKIFRSANFLRREVVPRREAILTIAQEIEELNDANLAAQRAEVARRQALFRRTCVVCSGARSYLASRWR